MIQGVSVIGFDADDTLWDNEPFYRNTEDEFIQLFNGYLSGDDISRELYKTEMQNLMLYGYGSKAFVLSMIETSLRISPEGVSHSTVEKILGLGKKLMEMPIQLLNGVEKVLQQLKSHYRLIVATKGDLKDQERKLRDSGLAQFFHHIEVMSDKKSDNYSALLDHLDIRPCQFVMVGNSIKSDIQPVLDLGGYGIYVPYHTMWLHERVDNDSLENERFHRVESIGDILEVL
ncbi:MAG: HAD family hydrolase [Vulcanimicrobiota bacterium]